MRVIRDSFLKFLATNLPGTTIHPIRTDPNDPSTAVPAMNAISVHFTNLDLGVDLTKQHVVIDVIYDSENDCVDSMTAAWGILNASFTCPLLDYSDPTSPVPVGTNNIFWDSHGIKFRAVRADYYCHYTCSLTLVCHTN